MEQNPSANLFQHMAKALGIALLLCLCVTVNAQDRVAVVNIDQIMAAHPGLEHYQQQSKLIKKRAEQAYQKKYAYYQDSIRLLAEQIDRKDVSLSERQRHIVNLNRLEREYRVWYGQIEGKLQSDQIGLQSEFEQSIRVAIQILGPRTDYNYIIAYRPNAEMEGLPDLTQEVIEVLKSN